MMEIRHVQASDREFWIRLDAHLPPEQFDRKVRDRQGYVALLDGRPVGLMRYNLFWDGIPFCTMLYVDEACRGAGVGSALMARWEREMADAGYGMALVSTQVDEDAQHFYRKLGWRDCGCLVLELPGFEQPMEMFLARPLKKTF